MKKLFKNLSFSLGLIVFCFLFPVYCRAATLYLMPQSQTIYESDSFIVDVRLNSEGEEINAVALGLVIPDSVDVIDFSDKKVRDYLLDDGPVFNLFYKDKIETLFSMDPIPNSYSKFLFNYINTKMFLEAQQESYAIL